MKTIGTVGNGNVVVEMTLAEQMALIDGARVLTGLACVKEAPEELVETPRCADAPQRAGARVLTEKENAVVKRALRFEARFEKKPGNTCVICGKPCKRTTCSVVCRKKKDRNYANAWYAKNKAVKPGRKATVVVTATETKEAPSAVVLTPGARMAAIRAADERVRERLAVKGGGL
jgi:hypothetical protein